MDEQMHNEGVPEAAARAQVRREIERSDMQGDAVAEAVMKVELGTDYEPAMRLLQKHIAGLPPDQVAKLNLHDPATLRALGRQALGALPRTRREAETELQATRERMTKDPKGYFGDDRVQLRYRLLLAQLDKLP